MLGVAGFSRALGADAGHPGDDHRLVRLQLRISQRMAARLGAVPHRRQPDRLCPHRRHAASIRCCSTPPRPSGAGAAGGGCCSTNMARPTSSSPRSSCGGSIRAARRSASSPPATAPTASFLGRFTLRVGEQRRRCRACSTRACGGSTALYRQALRPGPAAARSDPGDPRRRRCRRRSRRPPRTRSPTRPSRRRRRAGPGRADQTFNVQVATPDAGVGPAGRSLGEPGRRRHLGDHHQPRARRHLGDARHLRRRRRRASRPRSGAGLERVGGQRQHAEDLALTGRGA